MAHVVQVGLDATPSAGGSATALQAVRDALGGKVISFTSEARWGEIHEGDGVQHLRPGRGWLGRFFHKPPPAELARTAETLEGAGLLIVHTLYRYHAHWARKTARAHGIPYWVLVHGGLDPHVLTYRRFRKMRWLNQFGRQYLRDAQQVLFATRNEQAKAAPFLDGVQSQVLPWPVEPAQPANPAKARRRWREQLGVGEHQRMLLFLGRLQEVKRPLEILEAFRQARAPDTHLVFAGPSEGCSPDELLHLARLMNVPRVHATGPVYNWRKAGLLAAADGLVSLSAKENFNFAAAEAMAIGKPVLLSPGNDLQGELAGVPCGWLLQTTDTAEAARAIREFNSLPTDQLAALGETARQWAAHNLGPGTFKQRLQELLAQQ